MDTPEIEPLKLREITLFARYEYVKRLRLFRRAIAIMVLVPVATIGERDIVFDYLEIDSITLEVLLESPQNFILGSGPFFCGIDFPDSYIEELAQKNNVAADSLIIFDGDEIYATIYGDEIPALQSWMSKANDLLEDPTTTSKNTTTDANAEPS
ncbi:hypothetical protein SAMN04489737_0313 [Arcanobacterium phocae]|uniref:Uncharacterized protein n=1 Tax=Arcanobacterium phocae TaxID=131112 RepID=A0A1H2LAM0_9ACTO|nr:hypothetical protein [Arcanobacterium phocae]SDU78080.1 hypothetical protein SAMN04489737_0313 [Arcanobacterium phocae]